MARRKRRRAYERSNTANAKQMRNSLEWLCDDESVRNLPVHGNTSWKPFVLVTQTLLWVLSDKSTLGDAFDQASGQCDDLLGERAVGSYQGLLKALCKRTDELMKRLIEILQQRMDEVAGRFSRIGGFYPIACDGSKPTAPRTKSNEKAFVSSTYGQGKNAKYRKRKRKRDKVKTDGNENKVTRPAPSVLVTMMWQMSLRLPWCWKLGKKGSNERQHVLEMINENSFPKNTLFVADAGFVGYDFWNAIIQAGHFFLIRVGANVNLLQHAGYKVERRKDIVYCWPDDVLRQGMPPLKLRVVRVKIGKLKVTLLTNVMCRRTLRKKLALRLYKLRWGVELEFRSLKQTFKRRKLRCRSSDRVLVEMNWSILATAFVELFALKEHMSRHTKGIPEISFAKSLRAIRGTLESLHRPVTQSNRLDQLLTSALLDTYERTSSKKARYKPKSSYRPPTGEPKIKLLQEKHLKQLQQTTAL